MADHTERIKQIREILQSGVTSVTTDGQTTVFDHASLRQELRQLMAEDEGEQGRRPVASSIYLGGF